MGTRAASFISLVLAEPILNIMCPAQLEVQPCVTARGVLGPFSVFDVT